MPVSKEDLETRINEVAGGDETLAASLREIYGKSESAATRFVGGFTRTDDYTRKTQDLAKQKTQLAAVQTEFEERLTEAEKAKDKIMRDLANERISAGTANARLMTLKEKYALDDDDIPTPADVKKTASSGTVVDSTDLDAKFAAFETRLMSEVTKKLVPELTSLARLGPIMNDIAYEHEKLTGKRMTRKEQEDLLQEASKSDKTVQNFWEEKYQIQDKRLDLRDRSNKEKWQAEWDAELKRKQSEEAISGIRNRNAEQDPANDNGSPIFRRKFEATPDPIETANNGNDGKHKSGENNQPSLRGADAAAARFIERRSKGVPMGGTEQPVRKTA